MLHCKTLFIWAAQVNKVLIRYEPCHDKTCFCHMQTTKAQISLHIRALISAFAVYFLDSIILPVSISKISSLYLAPVAVQAGSCLTWSQTRKTDLLVTRLISKQTRLRGGCTSLQSHQNFCCLHKQRQRARDLRPYLSLITRKPVFRVSDRIRLKPACSATEAS